eukprot:6861339-Prymnesium_polylepis.1
MCLAEPRGRAPDMRESSWGARGGSWGPRWLSTTYIIHERRFTTELEATARSDCGTKVCTHAKHAGSMVG